MGDQSFHEAMMRRALALARQAEGRTSPNPLVGAVLVKDGRIVGEGYHRRAGAPHAEVEALRAAGEAARGATLYVNLEPCAHFGRTPPCAQALIAAGVAEVYYAVPDPNPLVRGKGHAMLAQAGIKVHQGLLAEEATLLNRPFFKYITTGRPFVIAKFAMSLDGKIATRLGESRWITNAASRLQAHRLRNICDAIAVGVGTVLADNPRLTTRLPNEEVRHPLRVVLDSRGRIPTTAQVFSPTLPGHTVLATTKHCPLAYRRRLEAQGVEVWVLPEDTSGRVDLRALLEALARREVMTLLVEGGSELLGAFVQQRLVDRVWAFIAPLLIGGHDAPGPVGGTGVAYLREALRVQNLHYEIQEGDLWVWGEILNEGG